MIMTDWMFSFESALAALPEGTEARFTYPLRHGSMRIGIYAPHGHDPQAPHEQDELYIIASGTGFFVKKDERRPFKPGDAIFVEAHARHRFEDFSDDFATWVIFWGPKGGE
ncbi:cupin domain-containing protein [Rhizorhabdus dicambivorans]|uniref:Cupin domain-containing protein n=2 Tax=Rhizorhabdus dicambivorans TaxID=1850238 RepID=A0A2A4G2M5_9SPHN|nr:cupin domain-containing protein [Rhizorhabdus dicambivorans]PCE44274.1 cupin domain-containing protein [Rhizorhabdus dicambivorans]